MPDVGPRRDDAFRNRDCGEQHNPKRAQPHERSPCQGTVELQIRRQQQVAQAPTDPTNSPITAPITANVTVTFAPAKTNGSAAGNWTFRKI